MSQIESLRTPVHTDPHPRFSPELRNWLRDRLPGARPIAEWLRAARQRVRAAWHAGGKRHCPICRSSIRHFAPFGVDSRPDAQCPLCGSLERHRMAWLFLERRTNFAEAEALHMLHFAPEPVLQERFQTMKSLRYVSADLENPRAALRADISRIPLCGPDLRCRVL